MRTKLLTATTLAMLTILTACDYAERSDARQERNSREYQSAMSDYTAGRLDAAIVGFEKAAFEDPANANARFQLACLLQEHKKDWLGAFCGYREYLMQHPRSDKAQLARDRMLSCEREMAKALAAKHKLLGDDTVAKELAATRDDLRKSEQRTATLERELETARARVNSLLAERDRLLAFVKGDDEDQKKVVFTKSVAEIEDLLNEDDARADTRPTKSEIATLREEEKEELTSSSTALPARKAEDLARREGQRAAEALARENEARNKIVHPATYAVQDGDTLYKIALKFYGRTSAWKKIREANKTVISNDGKVRVGDVLRLPD